MEGGGTRGGQESDGQKKSGSEGQKERERVLSSEGRKTHTTTGCTTFYYCGAPLVVFKKQKIRRFSLKVLNIKTIILNNNVEKI